MLKLVNNKIRVVLTGGGTGGHIFPLLAVAEKIWEESAQNPLDLELIYIGPTKGPFAFDTSIFDNLNIRTVSIISESPSNVSNPLFKIVSLFKSFVGTLQSLWYLWVLMPDVIFSKGGYGALPVLLVGFLYRIPIVIHESDSLPGRINTLSRKFASRVAISFEKSARFFPLAKTALVGNPIRRSFFAKGDKKQACAAFELEASRQTVLILGGSQGAQVLNDLVLNVLEFLLEKHQVIHQCGTNNYQEVQTEAKTILHSLKPELQRRYKLFAFLDENQIRSAYEVADLVVSRAGSGSIFEIAAKAKPSILIPFSAAARDHQRENAYDYAQGGAAVVLEEGNLKSQILLQEIELLLTDKARLKKMAQAANEFAKPEAGAVIAKELLHLAGAAS